MFVKSIIIPKFKCHSVQQEDSLKTVLEMLEDHQIDGLPVLNGEKYVGIITRYQIYEHFFKQEDTREQFLQNTVAKDIATHQEKYLQGEELFESTLLDVKDFPLLAVVDGNRTFIGIVTRFDILEQFQSAFGMKRSGVRIAFTSVETEGRIARLADIARQFHESIISLVTFDETDKLVRRIVMKVEKKDNLDKFIRKLEDSGFRVLNIKED